MNLRYLNRLISKYNLIHPLTIYHNLQISFDLIFRFIAHKMADGIDRNAEGWHLLAPMTGLEADRKNREDGVFHLQRGYGRSDLRGHAFEGKPSPRHLCVRL